MTIDAAMRIASLCIVLASAETLHGIARTVLVVLSNIPFSQPVSTSTAPPSEPTPSSPPSSDSPEER